MIAVVGAGYWGPKIIRVLTKHKLLSLIVESNADRRSTIQTQYPQIRCVSSLEDALSDAHIQALVLATPAASHASLAMLALHAHKDVFVEKPLALSTQDAIKAQQLAAKNHRILMAGHILQYHPALHAMEQRKSQLGALRYLCTDRLGWGRIRHEETLLWSLAPHDIGLALQLFSQMPQQVSARGAGWLRAKSPDIIHIELCFEDATAFSTLSWLSPQKSQRVMLVGSQQSLVWEEPAHILTCYNSSQPSWEDKPTATPTATLITLSDEEPLEAELLHFVECVRERKIPRTDATFAVEVLRVLEACERSLAHNGASVSL
jgi:UDP-2-acetamido-3-amino-2,3-dideoxy-glucuronate N-acetyltransferase